MKLLTRLKRRLRATFDDDFARQVICLSVADRRDTGAYSKRMHFDIAEGLVANDRRMIRGAHLTWFLDNWPVFEHDQY